MNGTDAATGKRLSGIAHLRQSVVDILTTPIGSRVMRRDYGSRLPRLVDRPLNPDGLVELYAATAEALAKWEPRLELQRVWAEEAGAAGRVAINLECRYLPDGKSITMEGIVL